MDKVLKVFGEGINDFYGDICTDLGQRVHTKLGKIIALGALG